jgi:hypothetical protein
MVPNIYWPTRLVRRNRWLATRLPRHRMESDPLRFFAGVLVALPVSVLLWLLILYAARTALGFG